MLVDVLTANSWVLLPGSIPDQNFREPWFIEMNFFKDGSYVYEHMLLDEDRDLIGHLVYEKGAYEIRNGSFLIPEFIYMMRHGILLKGNI